MVRISIFVERAGKLKKWEKGFTSREKLEDVIQQIVGKCNRVINESMPICGCASGERGEGKCRDPSGSTGTDRSLRSEGFRIRRSQWRN